MAVVEMCAHSTLAAVQCTANEIKGLENLQLTVIPVLRKLTLVTHIVLVCPRLLDPSELKEFKLNAQNLGLDYFFGSEHNVADRIKCAAKHHNCDVIIRVLLRQFYLDVACVERQYSDLIFGKNDLASVPPYWNYALTGDVYTLEALTRAITHIQQIESQAQRCAMLFSPTVFMEQDRENFKVVYSKPSATYAKSKSISIRKRLKEILEQNSVQFSSNYAGSSYAFITERIKYLALCKILDIACGKGNGCERLSYYADEVVGVDNSIEYIETAQFNFGSNKKIHFECKDALHIDYENYFDCVCSLHTLEHLSRPVEFINKLHKALKVGGILFLEVPLLFPQPMGMPLNPYHVKEYTPHELYELLLLFKLEICSVWGKDRHAFFEIDANELVEQVALQRRATALLIFARKWSS